MPVNEHYGLLLPAMGHVCVLSWEEQTQSVDFWGDGYFVCGVSGVLITSSSICYTHIIHAEVKFGEKATSLKQETEPKKGCKLIEISSPIIFTTLFWDKTE